MKLKKAFLNPASSYKFRKINFTYKKTRKRSRIPHSVIIRKNRIRKRITFVDNEHMPERHAQKQIKTITYYIKTSRDIKMIQNMK